MKFCCIFGPGSLLGCGKCLPFPTHATHPTPQTCPGTAQHPDLSWGWPPFNLKGFGGLGGLWFSLGPQGIAKTRATNRNRRLTVARPCSPRCTHCVHLGRAGPGAEGSKLRFVAAILAIHWAPNGTIHAEPLVGITLWRDRSEGEPSRCARLWASSPTRTRGRGLKMTVASADGDHFTSGRRRSKLFLV